MNRTTVNAYQLFLLCVLRGTSIPAKNLESYKRKGFSEQVPKERCFVKHKGDFFTLSDHDEDLTWYDPGFNDPNNYTGEFKLRDPVTDLEEFVLKTYCR